MSILSLRTALLCALLPLYLLLGACAPLLQEPPGEEDPEVGQRVERLQERLQQLQEKLALLEAGQALETKERKTPPVWDLLPQPGGEPQGFGLYTYLLMAPSAEGSDLLPPLLGALDSLPLRGDLPEGAANRFLVPSLVSTSDSPTPGIYNWQLSGLYLASLGPAAEGMGGPLLVASHTPLDPSRPPQAPLLILDLSQARPPSAGKALAAFQSRVEQGSPPYAQLLFQLLEQASPASLVVRRSGSTLLVGFLP